MNKSKVRAHIFGKAVVIAIVFGPIQTFASQTVKQIYSDPYRAGKPSVYSIVKGDERVTFYNPYFGNFTRAEIRQRSSRGWIVTRFLMSSDGKTYRPVMRTEIPFSIQHSVDSLEKCDDVVSSLAEVREVLPKVQHEKLVSEMKERLVRSGFYEKSCFDPKISQAKRDAMMLGAAEVMVPDANPKPAKYYQCLENHGFADVAGDLKERFLGLDDRKKKPKITMGCGSTDPENKASRYLDSAGRIELEISFKAKRENNAFDFFHESLHAVDKADHSIVNLATNCCAAGGDCGPLDALARGRQKTASQMAATEMNNPIVAPCAATVAALGGRDGESLAFANKKDKQLAQSSTAPHQTAACILRGEKACSGEIALCMEQLGSHGRCQPRTLKSAFAQTGELFQNVFFSTARADVTCSDGEKEKFLSLVDTKATQIDMAKETNESLSRINHEGPINFPQEVQLAASPAAPSSPSRSPASVPLPRTTVETDSSREAVTIFDTISRATDRVAAVVSPEEVSKRKVELSSLGSRSSGKSFVKNDLQFITASFQDPTKNLPLATADFSGIALSFNNPFAKTDSSSAPAEKGSRSSATKLNEGDAEAGNGQRDVAAKRIGTTKQLEAAQKPTAAASLDVPSGGVPSQSTNFVAPSGSMTSSSNSGNRNPNSTASSKLSRSDIFDILTGEYTTVRPKLIDAKFEESIRRNSILVIDREGRRIGASKPNVIFVFEKSLNRLVPQKTDSKEILK